MKKMYILIFHGDSNEIDACSSVTKLSDFDTVPGLEQFVIDNVGPNCYTI